jgi:hypothetical protein
MGGAIQSEVNRAKSDGSENWPSIRTCRNRTAFLMQTRVSHFQRALRATRSAIILPEPVASGIASQFWTIPGQEKRRSAPFDGLRGLGLERIQLQIQLRDDGSQAERATKRRQRSLEGSGLVEKISSHGSIS